MLTYSLLGPIMYLFVAHEMYHLTLILTVMNFPQLYNKALW